jgi:hypothetical protein
LQILGQLWGQLLATMFWFPRLIAYWDDYSVASLATTTPFQHIPSSLIRSVTPYFFRITCLIPKKSCPQTVRV